MKSLVVAVALLLTACATPKVEKASCPENRSWASMAARLNITEAPQPVPADVRVKLLSNYNNLPPVSDYNPKYVLVLSNRQGAGMLIFVDEAWCVELINPVTPDEIRVLLSIYQV